MSLYLGTTPICGGIEGNQLNNPFSLLDYKFSEYEISNASWLRSNGQYNSGTTYADVYNLLLQIKNGTVTKAGVSVKLSTETYADTDFVLNTSDTTFRLPLKVALASGKGIVGNGITLGLTDGTNNFGLTPYESTYTWLQGSRNTYGTDVGTTPTVSTVMHGKTAGLTTDPTKSGIETSVNGLYLYFYVGETVQDANLINAGQVLNDIANLKSGYYLPDYSAGIEIVASSTEQSYTCPSDGFVIFSGGGFNGQYSYLKVNDVVINNASTTGNGYITNVFACALVSKNDVCKFRDYYNSVIFGNFFKFFPLKGVN